MTDNDVAMSASSRRTLTIMLAALAVVALAVVGALLLGDDGDDTTDAAVSTESTDTSDEEVAPPPDDTAGEPSGDQGPGETAEVTLLGDPLTPYDREAAVDPAVGSPAPGFVAPDFSGTEHTVQPGDGTAKVIGFFTHWCSHCQAELPRLADWLNNNSVPEGVEVIAVSTAVDEGAPNFPPSTWFEAEQWPALVVRDSPESLLAAAYGLPSFPYFVVVGADGNVLTRVSGQLETPAWEALLADAAPVAS